MKTHSDDVEIVTQHWRQTHTWRRKLLEIEKISVQDYLPMFKPLREQLGCDLVTFLTLCKLCALNVKNTQHFIFIISYLFFIYLFNIYAPNIDFQIKIDFELLHNTKTNCLLDKWEIAARHLIKLIKDAQLSVVDKKIPRCITVFDVWYVS